MNIRGYDESGIIYLTSDERIVTYLRDKIFYSYYEDTVTSNKYGILAGIMVDGDFGKFQEIEKLLKSVSVGALRDYMCRCIVERLPIYNIIEFIKRDTNVKDQ